MIIKPSFSQIIAKIQSSSFPQELDLVVGITNGGIVPGYLLSQYLKIPLVLLAIKFKDENKNPLWDKPKLIESITFSFQNKRLLLVDDRSKTGSTLQFAKEQLTAAKEITTCVVNGRADISLFDQECFPMPWEIAARV
jgi:xanthine phosphoribosyltransferase